MPDSHPFASFSLRGLVAAPFTPFRPDGSVDLSQIAPYARYLIAQNVAGAFVCGTTGEGFSLTVEERLAIAEEWVRVAGKELAVIVHVGHPAIGDARRLAAHAAEIGADAFAAMPTSCFRPGSVQALSQYIGEIASAAPTLPFYYYHFPALCGVNFKAYDLLVESVTRIPNLRGVKYTHEDLMDYGRCLTLDRGWYDMLFGRDEIMLAGLALGAQGFVGSTYNFAAPLYHSVIESFGMGDIGTAREAQSQSRELIALLVEAGGQPAFKAVLDLLGLQLGPMRTPLTNLSEADRQRLAAKLEDFGFFKFALPALQGV